MIIFVSISCHYAVPFLEGSFKEFSGKSLFVIGSLLIELSARGAVEKLKAIYNGAPPDFRKKIRDEGKVMEAACNNSQWKTMLYLHSVWDIPYPSMGSTLCPMAIDGLLSCGMSPSEEYQKGVSIHDASFFLRMASKTTSNRGALSLFLAQNGEMTLEKGLIYLHAAIEIDDVVLAKYLVEEVGVSIKMKHPVTSMNAVETASYHKRQAICNYLQDELLKPTRPFKGREGHKIASKQGVQSAMTRDVSEPESKSPDQDSPTSVPTSTRPTLNPSATAVPSPPAPQSTPQPTPQPVPSPQPPSRPRATFNPSIPRDRLTLEKKPFAKGAFSKVYRGTLDGAPVAIKVFLIEDLSLDVLRAKVAQEAELLQRCLHPNIAFSYGICADFSDEDEPFVAIVMEHYAEGNLGELIKKSKGGIEGPLAARLLEGIACGLAHLHSNQVVHKDLKPDNVLLRRDEEGELHAVLTDFGLSVDLAHSSRKSNIAGGTVPYKAPEQLNPYDREDKPLKITPKADIYSLGVIAWELATREEPWAEATELGIIQRVCNLGKRLEFPKSMDPAWCGIRALVHLCFEADPEHRPQAEVLARALGKIKN